MDPLPAAQPVDPAGVQQVMNPSGVREERVAEAAVGPGEHDAEVAGDDQNLEEAATGGELEPGPSADAGDEPRSSTRGGAAQDGAGLDLLAVESTATGTP